MTIDDLKKVYPLPEKILLEYFSEFCFNVIGTKEYDLAIEATKQMASYKNVWVQQLGKQDQNESMTVTAFNPPPAFTTKFTDKAAYMLPRFSDNDKAYYSADVTGFIDYRLGTFETNIYPVHVMTISVNNAPMKIWKINIDIWVKAYPYAGLKTLIAMSENGLSIPGNLTRIKAAQAYVSAFEKFKTELDTARNLAQHSVEADLPSVVHERRSLRV